MTLQEDGRIEMESFVCDDNQLIDPKETHSENYFELNMQGRYLSIKQDTLVVDSVPYMFRVEYESSGTTSS